MEDENKNNWAKYANIGFQMAITIGLGVWLGTWLDKKFPNENSLFTLLMALLAIFVSLYYVIRQLPKP